MIELQASFHFRALSGRDLGLGSPSRAVLLLKVMAEPNGLFEVTLAGANQLKPEASPLHPSLTNSLPLRYSGSPLSVTSN